MSQTVQQDLEGGGDSDGQRTDTHHRSTPIQSSELSESDYVDGSWPLYTMYSKIARDEDNKLVERCQRYTDGTLIFTGLFSATVGALLTVSIPDLKPNSQDISAFYLQNIYQHFGNTNISSPSIPSTLAKPPAFSPPRYAIWVNSLWFLSLTLSLSGAMGATMFRSWAVHYIETNWMPWYSPVKRARIRTIFAKGSPGPYTFWGTSGSTDTLHYSLLLFIAGGLIYLFNINRAVFYAVVWCVGIMITEYAVRSVTVFFKPHSLFHTPFSLLALEFYLGISYLVFQVCFYLPSHYGLRDNARRHYRDLSGRYGEGFLIGKQRAVKEIASKPSSEIDAWILWRMLRTLDEDHTLEMFFDAIPGFCHSKLTVSPLSSDVQSELRQALDGLLDRTFSSNLVSESVRASRLITCLNAAHAALGPRAVSKILDGIFHGHWNKVPQSVEIGHALRLWSHRQDHDLKIRQIVACIIARVRGCDERWTLLVRETFGVPDRVFRDYLAHGDSGLLSILIHVSRQANAASFWTSGVLSSLSKFDIRNTLPELQHEFWALWNGTAQEARKQGPYSTPAKILREILHLYIALPQDTDAISTPFSTSINSLISILYPPSSYNLSDVRPTVDSSMRLAEETSVIAGFSSSPDLSTTSEIGETSQAPTATFPLHSNPPSSNRSLQDGVATMQPDATAAAKLSYLENNMQQGLSLGQPTPYVAPLADGSGTLSTVPAPAPLPASTPPVPVMSSSTYDPSRPFISESSLPVSSSCFSASDSLSPAPVLPLPLPDAELLSPRSGMAPKYPTDDVTSPHLHPSGLVNDGDMGPINALLQSLIYCPPFRDVFSDLGRLVGQFEGGEFDGSATPLMDASAKYLDKFAYKEKSPMEKAGKIKLREDEDVEREAGGVYSFQSTDVYDAMKEKRRFIIRDGPQQGAAAVLGLYLEALDEELVTLRSSISTHKPATTLTVEKLEDKTQLGEGQTAVREQGYTASPVDSELSISRIFGGRSRSTIRALNQPDAITVEDWRSLDLNIQPDSVKTILDALTHVSESQPVLVRQSAQSSPSGASQQVEIESLPPILVLHLERFLYDATAGGVVKINKSIQLVPELEIPPQIMAPVTGKSAEPVQYKLYGVLYHHGESAGSGNYTVDVLHPNGDGARGEAWLRIDDGSVSVVRHEDVFECHDNEQGNDRCAYMLLYCHTATSART